MRHIAARALNSPLLLEPGYARFMFAALGPRLNINALVDVDGGRLANDQFASMADSFGGRDAATPYQVIDGIAVINLSGTLVHKSSGIDALSGMAGYNALANDLAQAMDDPAVRGIMLDCDSPGGEVAGCQALADKITNSTKPVWAHANEMAASAAYWLASAADELYLSETAMVGSIGVLMAHADNSQAIAAEGVTVTLIYSGAHKVDGNPYEALSDDVKAKFQADIDGIRTLFASTVASNRGMTTDAVLATEAQVYRGQDAVDAGLADGVMSFDQALQKFSSSLAPRGAFTPLKGATMSKQADSTTITPEMLSEAVKAGADIARAEGMTAGAAAERARIGAITGSAEAKGRETTALKFATGSNMTADECRDMLASVPTVTGHDVRQAVTLAGMAQHAVVRSDASGESAPTTLAQRVAASHAKVKGA